MSWNDPAWLLLAAGAVLLLAAVPAGARWRTLQQARLASGSLWRRWLGGVPATGAARAALWLLAAAAAAVAAAGPRWGRPSEAGDAGLEVAVALDVSSSMRCADVDPDRLGLATAVLRELVARVPGATWGLATGAGAAEARVPLTADAETMTATLADGELDRGLAPGSNLAALLATAASLLETGGPRRAVLLASDGEELEGDAAAVAAALRASGIAVVALGVGTPAGAPVPRRDASGRTFYVRDARGALVRSRVRFDLLRRLGATPGDAVDAAATGASRRLAEALARATRGNVRETAPVRARAFALVAAALATASFLLWPWRRAGLALAAALIPLAACAGPPTPAAPTGWQRVLPGTASVLARRGAAALARGAWPDAERAYGRAMALRPRDASLRFGWATAAALAGDRRGEDALTSLTGVPALAAQAWYNLGTARLMHDDRPGAVEALRRAVALQPERSEAWHNLELAIARARGSGGAVSQAGDPGARSRLVQAAARAALAPAPSDRVLPPAEPAGGGDW